MAVVEVQFRMSHRSQKIGPLLQAHETFVMNNNQES